MHRIELTPEWVLLGLFGIALLFQLWFYLGIFSRLAFSRKKNVETENQLPPVSVIICARNEDENLENFLPLVLNQDYPDYEVIVVDDCSFDNTNDVLKEFAKNNIRMRYITIKEEEHHPHGKKFALMVGIKGAKHEHLLLTDADCKPVSEKWIRNMARNFTEEKEIVLGYGGYEKKKGLLNTLIRFDSFFIALQYLSFAMAGRAYMGVGRNLAYKKNLYVKHKGFASHYFLESGDDDLFINQVSTPSNVAVEWSKDSITSSRTTSTFKGWMRQKRRHITTAKHYRFRDQFRLGMLGLSQYVFFVSFIILLLLNCWPEAVLSAFGIRFLSQMIVFKKTMDRLNEKDLLLISPLLELYFMFFYPALALSGIFIRKNKWMN